jgi:DNA-directed RNA polymerase sigma subunit (sigma70/sigma32)
MHREAMEAALDWLPRRGDHPPALRARRRVRCTLEEVGGIFCVTRERVRQIQIRALARLCLLGRLPGA